MMKFYRLRSWLGMFRILARAAWRGWRAHPWIAMLNVLGIAIGTGVYLAIRMVNHSATESFAAGLELVGGRSHLEITADAAGLDETLWPAVASEAGVKAVTGVVEAYGSRPDKPGEYLRIIGVDPFTGAAFFPGIGGEGGGSEAWFARRDSVMVSSLLAEQEGWRKGGRVRLLTGGRSVEVEIQGIYPLTKENAATMRAAYMDIGWAQELTGTAGRLHSLQIMTADVADVAAVQAALEKRLPPDVTVAAPARRNAQTGLMLQGFQLNLTALSMVSLLVGVFLTGNTIAASVMRQRREIGILRAVGASAWQIRTVFLGEATVSALLGAALGLPLAGWLAGNMLGSVGQAISAHYVQMSLEQVVWQASDVWLAGLGAMAAALAGAWWPALEATRVDPVAVLRPGRDADSPQNGRRVWLWLAVAFTAAAAWLAWQALHTGPAWLSFAACLCCVAGFACAARLSAQCVASAAAWFSRRFRQTWLRIAAGQVSQSLHRAAPTVAALLTAVSMVLGVTVMIHSFRSTLSLWVEGTLRADLYVAPAANEVVKQSAVMPPGAAAWLRARPEVEDVETLIETKASLTDGRSCRFRVVERSPQRPFEFMEGGITEKYAQWFQTDNCAVSEILAARLHLRPGSTLTFKAAAGEVQLTVSGVFYDYSDDQGCLYIDRANYLRHWPPSADHALAAYLRDPAQAGAVGQALRSAFSRSGELAVYENAALKKRVFDIFDQTFAVTSLMKLIAVAVALLGISMALSTLVAGRRWEISVLRSLGAGKGQVAAFHLGEAGLIGLASALPGMVCGLGLAMILTWVVNRAFFGWTIYLSIPWAEVLWTPVWVVAAAVIAGAIPAWLAAGTGLAGSLRSE